MSDSFKAFIIDQNPDGAAKQKTIGSIETLNNADLPDENVLIKVDYSSLNYKDGLAVTGKGRICRQLPMVGGIDLAGTVLESDTTPESIIGSASCRSGPCRLNSEVSKGEIREYCRSTNISLSLRMDLLPSQTRLVSCAFSGLSRVASSDPRTSAVQGSVCRASSAACSN